MRSAINSRVVCNRFAVIGLAAALLAAAPLPAFAVNKFELLYQFRGGDTDGQSPDSAVIFGATQDTLYGVTATGGPNHGGILYALMKGVAGKPWKRKLLYAFQSNSFPYGPPVLWNNTLYGTTGSGSAHFNGSAYAFGLANHTFDTLYDFDTDPSKTGSDPQPGLHLWNGRLFDAMAQGGPGGGGTLFALSPPAASNDPWGFKLITAFNGKDGFNAAPGFIIYQNTIFGNTYSGGGPGLGVVYKVSQTNATKDTWSENVLSTFQGGSDGAYPYGMLAVDAQGALVGTTERGGADNSGTIFQMVNNGGKWTRQTVLSLPPSKNGPAYPSSGLVSDSNGNLYGMSLGGGANGVGAIYEVQPPDSTHTDWRLTLLHSFDGKHGSDPYADLLVQEVEGQVLLYGTTQDGGKFNHGTVFRLTL